MAVLAKIFGFSWLNVCRIIRVAEDDGPVKQFGFTYANLSNRVGMGMESFVINWTGIMAAMSGLLRILAGHSEPVWRVHHGEQRSYESPVIPFVALAVVVP